MKTISVTPALARSAVHRKVPIRVRCRLDRLILSRPKGCATEEAMARRLKLTERYGVSAAALKRYARQLERCLRPVVASQLTAAMLGCLPAEYRRQITDGGQMLLLSKVMQALTDPQSADNEPPRETLSVADLARLAAVVRAVGSPSTSGYRPGHDDSQNRVRGRRDAEQTAGNPGELSKAVQLLYGLSWPLPSTGSEQRRSETGKTEEKTLTR
ncbi:MAG: hypothetical protein KA354_11610 [Phycisphaerae bacterium]|nr:hypothetical protein [Phycisphaerae bacterium]